MVIDDITYKLPFNNYFSMVNKKKQIVIGHTFNNNMKHIIGWLHRYNGEYKKTAPFTIDISGVIYKHFEPKYQSKFFNDLELDSKTIVILLENDGCLLKDTKKNNYINWIGDIYSKDIFEKKWRSKIFWEPYTKEQINSLIELSKKLLKKFSIDNKFILFLYVSLWIKAWLSLVDCFLYFPPPAEISQPPKAFSSFIIHNS